MKISYPLFIAGILLSLIIGIGIGFASSPAYISTMKNPQNMDLGAADRWIDLRYINAMVAHHRGAILLATVAKKESKRTEIREHASMILENEPKLINELYDWKRDWYGDTRRVNDPITPNLSTADKTFDLRFLNALIAHHEAGIAMTQEVRMKSSNKNVLNNADAVESFLKNNLVTLKDWRTTWYLTQ